MAYVASHRTTYTEPREEGYRMVTIVRHSREDLEQRRLQLLHARGVSSEAELLDTSGQRELTVEEEDALEELRRIAFLLGEE